MSQIRAMAPGVKMASVIRAMSTLDASSRPRCLLNTVDGIRLSSIGTLYSYMCVPLQM